MSYLRVQPNNPTNVSDTKKILKSTSISSPIRRKSEPSWMTHKKIEQKFTARSSAHVKHNAGLNFRPPRHVGGFEPAGCSKGAADRIEKALDDFITNFNGQAKSVKKEKEIYLRNAINHLRQEEERKGGNGFKRHLTIKEQRQNREFVEQMLKKYGSKRNKNNNNY